MAGRSSVADAGIAIRLAAAAAAAQPAAGADPRGPHFTTATDGDRTTYTSVSADIRTVEDLLRHIDADMDRFEVEKSEATKWDMGSRGAGGSVHVTPLFRVWVRLRPRSGPGVAEAVEAMIAAARASLVPRRRPRHRRVRSGKWQVVVCADPHYAKYAWGRTTGWGDSDLAVIDSRVRAAAGQLCDEGDAIFRPVRRTIAFLGDVFHYDRPDGSTTAGTPLERDGRLPRMVDVGVDAVLWMIERSADSCQTDVVVVAGNHDEVLSAALHKILRVRFRGDRRVAIHPGLTSRVYCEESGNLMGFTHGHRAREKLPGLMPLEVPDAWARSTYREFHTGHLHHQAAVRERPIDTVRGVIVRTAPALCPPDDFHSAGGWVGAREAMESFFYRPGGGLDGILVAGPNVRPTICTEVQPSPSPATTTSGPSSTSRAPLRTATRRSTSSGSAECGTRSSTPG